MALEIYYYLVFLRRNSALWLLVLLGLLLGKLSSCSLHPWDEALLQRIHQRGGSPARSSSALSVHLLLLDAAEAVQVPGVHGLGPLLELVVELELSRIGWRDANLLLGERRPPVLYNGLGRFDLRCLSVGRL